MGCRWHSQVAGKCRGVENSQANPSFGEIPPSLGPHGTRLGRTSSLAKSWQQASPPAGNRPYATELFQYFPVAMLEGPILLENRASERA